LSWAQSSLWGPAVSAFAINPFTRKEAARRATTRYALHAEVGVNVVTALPIDAWRLAFGFARRTCFH